MEEILAGILQGEDADLLYDEYVDFLVTNGYVDYDDTMDVIDELLKEFLEK